jgi:uncharacterized protein YdeI (YjbR/CyaY-like superfamily)
MGKKDPRVDAYISLSAEFARPILKRLRKLVHEGCPPVEEDIKWGTPHFLYHGMFCGMAAFKNHCAFGFWNAAVLPANPHAMGHLGRITSVADLPPDREIVGYVQKAARLAESGVKGPRERKHPKRAFPVPPDLRAALRKNPRARTAFESFSPSGRQDYLQWLAEAKRPETRSRRLETAVAWMEQGKPHNWKYGAKRPKGDVSARFPRSASAR